MFGEIVSGLMIAFLVGNAYIQIQNLKNEIESLKLKHKDEMHAMDIKIKNLYKKEELSAVALELSENISREFVKHEKSRKVEMQEYQTEILDRLRVPSFGTVAFHASTSGHKYDIVPGTMIKFENVKLNIGDAYSPETGLFIAPDEGLYFFSWNYLINNGNTGYIAAMVNGVQQVVTCSYSNADPHNSGTGFILTLLKKGDKVWLETFYVNTKFLHQEYTHFLGFRISNTKQ